MELGNIMKGGTSMPRPRSRKTRKAPKELAFLGERLRKIRMRRGISQTELGKKLGLAQRTVSDYESGRIRMPADHLEKIAKFLRASVAELLGKRKLNDAPFEKDKDLLKMLQKVKRLTPRKQRQVAEYIELLSKA